MSSENYAKWNSRGLRVSVRHAHPSVTHARNGSVEELLALQEGEHVFGPSLKPFGTVEVRQKQGGLEETRVFAQYVPPEEARRDYDPMPSGMLPGLTEKLGPLIAAKSVPDVGDVVQAVQAGLDESWFYVGFLIKQKKKKKGRERS